MCVRIPHRLLHQAERFQLMKENILISPNRSSNRGLGQKEENQVNENQWSGITGTEHWNKSSSASLPHL